MTRWERFTEFVGDFWLELGILAIFGALILVRVL